VVVIVLAVVLWPRGPSAPLYDSIAVLPFVNLTPSPENEYFCDGLVDEITLTLSRIRGMRVAARTSAFQFREHDEDVREIGRQLNVSTVIEGSVRQMDSQLRVTAQLISTTDGFHLWAQTYDCDPAETFAVQEQISRDIARTLAIQWNGDSRLVRQHSADPAARAHYLRGRYFWNKRTAGDIRTAIGEFEEAIEIDPFYALAHAALADAHAVLAFNDQAPLAESVNQARSAALRALELDDNLAEAHAVLAWILVFHDWEWEEGERLFQHALDLNPNYSTGHQWYGLSLLPRRHFREALAQFRQAELLDPLSLIVSTDIGVTHYYSHQYRQALEQADAVLRMAPDFFLARLLRGAALVELDRTGEALPELEEAVKLSDRFTDAVMRLAHANAVAGRPDRARELLAELIETARSGDSSCYQVASVYAGLEDREAVWEWLGQAVDKHEAAVAFLDVDPIFDTLRDLPEFHDLRRRIHLED
jgi:serine/threonine-protein kinase